MTNKWYTILLLLVVLIVSAITVCAAGGPSCKPACGTGETCVKGECVEVQTCTKNTDCTDPQICDSRKGYCVPNPKACDDKNVCTAYDTTVKGKCVGTPVADDTQCTDNKGNTGECSNGQCVVDCGEGLLYCGGSCVYANDPNNCFACGNVCTGNQICDAHNYDPGKPACIDCSTLGTGYKACTVSVEPTEIKTCIDTSSDPNNCGNCGYACSGMTPGCFKGVCSCTDTSCPDGQYCDTTGTYPTCMAATTCPAGTFGPCDYLTATGVVLPGKGCANSDGDCLLYCPGSPDLNFCTDGMLCNPSDPDGCCNPSTVEWCV